MKTIYIDDDCKCYVTNHDDTLLAIETDFFDGKCDYFVEGYRFVPESCTWVREDGEAFYGEMIAPWKGYNELAAAQAQYELMMAEAAAAYREGVDSV